MLSNRRKTKTAAAISWIALILTFACSTHQAGYWDSERAPDSTVTGRIASVAERAFAEDGRLPGAKSAAITYPYYGAVFPSEISAPVFTWEPSEKNIDQWVLRFDFADKRKPIYVLSPTTRWEPDRELWERVKTYALENEVGFSVAALGRTAQAPARTAFFISKDSLEDTVLYRQITLPMSTARLKEITWRLGDIASYDPPPVVMEGLSICASCHSVSADGKTLGMEMNYRNDGGAQFIVPVTETIRLTDTDFFSWNDFPRQGILPESRGLFGRMSPSGNYAVASVNEISLALVTNNPAFSQVFFPTYGILGYYSTATKEILPLPGADDYRFVHGNPAWSRDEKRIAFTRAKTKNEVFEDLSKTGPRYIDAGIDELNDRYNIQFDIYTVPFNQGRGGQAVPLEGAADNGMSNYYPRFSPDGKWIVFTQSRTGIMLQPDATLFIVPSSGGASRRMNCNRDLFNSWHSWSANSRWLLFASKINSAYTEIFITHVDENGNDSPPVLLSRFSHPEKAANVPEFTAIPKNGLQKIVVAE